MFLPLGQVFLLFFSFIYRFFRYKEQHGFRPDDTTLRNIMRPHDHGPNHNKKKKPPFGTHEFHRKTVLSPTNLEKTNRGNFHSPFRSWQVHAKNESGCVAPKQNTMRRDMEMESTVKNQHTVRWLGEDCRQIVHWQLSCVITPNVSILYNVHALCSICTMQY